MSTPSLPRRIVSSSLASALCLTLCAVTAHAAEEAGASACRLTDYISIPIKSSRSVIILDGSINGQSAVVLADTGSTMTSLTKRGAEKTGLTLDYTRMQAGGIGGKSALYRTNVNDFAIGELHWHRIPMVVAWNGIGIQSLDALVGANVLFAKDLEVNLAKSELSVYEPKNCGDTFLATWDEQAVVVPMNKISWTDQRQTFEVQINGKPMRAMIDTGAAISVIDLKAAARAGITPESPGVTPKHSLVGLGEKKLQSWLAHFDSFAIGTETIQGPTISIANLRGDSLSWDDMPEMLLGVDFLRTHHVLFAVSQKRLYLSYLGGAPFAESTAQTAKNNEK